MKIGQRVRILPTESNRLAILRAGIRSTNRINSLLSDPQTVTDLYERECVGWWMNQDFYNLPMDLEMEVL